MQIRPLLRVRGRTILEFVDAVAHEVLTVYSGRRTANNSGVICNADIVVRHLCVRDVEVRSRSR